MPTQELCRFSCIAVLLTATLAARAEDFHIKKNIAVGGNFVSTTETSIKGGRERTVSQSPTGNTLTLRQCDLKRTVSLNEQSQTYFVTEDPQDEAALKAAAMATGTPMPESAAYITETSSVTDTGERKIMFGYNTRHLKTTVTLESSKNACSQLSQKYDVDGWYVDFGKDIAGCQQALPPVRQVEGCNDRVIRHRSGSAKPGYPMTENVLIYNADGTTTTVGVATSQISKQNLEPELFDIPPGYRQMKSQAELIGAPPTTQQALPVAAVADQPQTAPGDRAAAKNQTKKSAAAALKSSAAQQIAAQTTQPMRIASAAPAMPAGMDGMAGMMSGMPAIGSMPGVAGAQQHASPPLPETQPLAAKPPGKVRIGVAPPEAQLGQGNNAGADYSTPIRNAVVTLMSGPAVEIVALDAHIAMQLQAEAVQKQCDFVMYSGVTVKHSSGAGFGRFIKAGSMAASMTPMGAMAHGMNGGVAAAQAASLAASQMAQQQAISQLAGFNGQIKSKDDVSVEYQLVAPGQTTPLTQNSLKGKAKADGEDVLTPLLQQAATDVLTQVTRK